ncbi:hypothetical protein [Nannocystis sp.]|uniref:hypothetical protein n=1 Tax=Nannocystis sp. TaxID=1962667 RepID=UPI0025F42215|nr:hypothetical protein [Nannocystis sp.]MBK7829734.1 hypothetical protein [Nannocystis sp.]
MTKASFTGAMGGLFGADLKCQAAAKLAGLAEPERFHAYLSTADVDAKDRFQNVVASFPYVLVTGTKFANNFAALIEAGPLGEGIMVTENGSTLYKEYVATNTAPGGLRFSPDQHCQGWTSAGPAFTGRTGFSAVPIGSPDAMAWKTGQWWTGVFHWQCDKPVFHLYCLGNLSTIGSPVESWLKVSVHDCAEILHHRAARVALRLRRTAGGRLCREAGYERDDSRRDLQCNRRRHFA